MGAGLSAEFRLRSRLPKRPVRVPAERCGCREQLRRLRSLVLCLVAVGFATGNGARGATQPSADGEALTPIVSQRMTALPAAAATLILTAQEGGSLRVEALAVAEMAAEAGFPVALLVELDGRTLLGAQPPDELALELFAYALNAGDEVKAHLAERFRLVVRSRQEALYEGGVKFVGRLGVLPAGSYVVRVLLREPARQRFALRELRLELSTGEPPSPATPLLLAEPGDSWLLVRQGSEGAAADLFLASLQGHAALPVLVPGRQVLPSLRFRGLQSDRIRATARFLDAHEQPVAEVELITVEQERSTAGDRSHAPAESLLGMRLEVPDLAQGRYGVEVHLKGPGRSSSAGPRQPVFVAAAGNEGRAWTGLEVAGAMVGSGRAVDFQLPAAGSAKRRARAVAQAYRRVLVDLAGGDWETAVDGVYGLETEVFDTVEPDPRLLLARGEMSVINDLAEADAESLVPVMVLHLDLHRRYVEERRFRASSHTGDLATALAEIYAEKAGTEMAPSLSADVLGAIGAYLQAARLRAAGRRMLERALELDSRNPYALLQLAVGEESYGRYLEATSYLQRLVAVRPDAVEGRLRLAINLRRSGEVSEAARLLDALLSEPIEVWMLAVAYQELARLHLDAGRSGSAVRVLRQAVRQQPDFGRHQIQLAYALDRNSQAAAGRTVIATADSGRLAAGTSPRFVYNRRLGSDAGDRRQELLAGAVLRLSALAAVLDPRAQEGR